MDRETESLLDASMNLRQATQSNEHQSGDTARCIGLLKSGKKSMIQKLMPRKKDWSR